MGKPHSRITRPLNIAAIVKASGGAGPQGYFVIGPSDALHSVMPSGSQVFIRSQMSYALVDKDPDLITTTGSGGALLGIAEGRGAIVESAVEHRKEHDAVAREAAVSRAGKSCQEMGGVKLTLTAKRFAETDGIGGFCFLSQASTSPR